jgi:O-antigen/teichoic acid export membrane protein
VYLARVLAAEAFGCLSFAASVVFYLINFVDLGLSTYGIREIARDKSRLEEFVSNIVSFRFLIAAALFALFAFLVFLSDNSMLLKVLMAGCGLWLFTSALNTEWAFQGMEKMHMVFISFLTTGMLQFSLACIFIKSPADVLKFPLITFFGAAPIIIIYLKRLGFRPELLKPDLKSMRAHLASSLVIWSISVFVQIYNGADIIILGVLRSPAEVGYFSIARRAVGGIAFLMTFLACATLPRLSFTFHNDMEQFENATRRFLHLAVSIIILVFLPLIFFAKGLIAFAVGPEYLASVAPFQVLIAGLVLVFFNLPFSTGLIAAGLEREVLKQAFASAILNVVSNFLLIGKYGMMGAAVSFLMAELLALVWILTLYRKKIGTRAILEI